MRILSQTLTILLLLTASFASAQDTLFQYLNRNKVVVKEAGIIAYYVRMIVPNGVFWDVRDYYAKERTLAMYGSYSDKDLKVEEGSFIYYHKNGMVAKRGRFIHGKKVSLWRGYDETGQINDSSYYMNGIPYKSRYEGLKGNYTLVGKYDDSGKGTGYEWEYYDYVNNQMSACGKYSQGYLKDSTWTYYHKNGNPSYIATYEKGTLLTYSCYDTLGHRQASACDSFIMPEFPGDIMKYMSSHLLFPYAFEGESMDGYVDGRVVMKFAVYEDGSIHDIEVLRSMGNAFDGAVAKMINEMPKWIPGKKYNRPTKVYYTLPVRFER